MGSAASSSSLGLMPTDDAEALALLAERERRPEVIARTVREHDIDIDMALHELDAATLASLVSRKIDLAHLKKAVRQLRAHFDGERRSLNGYDRSRAGDAPSRDQLLLQLRKEGIMSQQEFEAFEARCRRLEASSPPAAAGRRRPEKQSSEKQSSEKQSSGSNKKERRMRGGVGIKRVEGNTVKIISADAPRVGDRHLGELLLEALELVAKGEIDVIELDDGDYQMQDGMGGVFTVFGSGPEDRGMDSLRETGPWDSVDRQVVIKAMHPSNGGRKGVKLRGCLRITQTPFNTEQLEDTPMTTTAAAAAASAAKAKANAAAHLPSVDEPGLADIHVLVEDISITNPGDNGGAHESLQHAVLVDGVHGHVRASLTNCDIYGCIHEHGCGVSVRHGAFCEIGHRTIVRECHTGIKVDSMGYIDCIGCQIYDHLLSGLLITNAVRAEAYADQLGQDFGEEKKKNGDGYDSDSSSSSSSRSSDEDEDKGRRKEEKDGRGDFDVDELWRVSWADDANNGQNPALDTRRMTAEEAEIQRLSQLQMSGPAPFSYIRGMRDKKGRVSRVTDISGNGDC
jgi:hypothetical protein